MVMLLKGKLDNKYGSTDFCTSYHNAFLERSQNIVEARIKNKNKIRLRAFVRWFQSEFTPRRPESLF